MKLWQKPRRIYEIPKTAAPPQIKIKITCEGPLRLKPTHWHHPLTVKVSDNLLCKIEHTYTIHTHLVIQIIVHYLRLISSISTQQLQSICGPFINLIFSYDIYIYIYVTHSLTYKTHLLFDTKAKEKKKTIVNIYTAIISISIYGSKRMA